MITKVTQTKKENLIEYEAQTIGFVPIHVASAYS
jgi:hypothetical protein